jgi:trans-2,3-dihydro-3-hydroxyanthranilate isomerase
MRRRRDSGGQKFQRGAFVSYRYRVLDVFTRHALEGNPLAVFPDSPALPTETMQKIARELNLSETVFVTPASRPDCVARLRIFTPGRELDFAGHPTVGTAFVLLDEGRTPQGASEFLLEENVGPVPIRVEVEQGASLIWLTTPPIRHGPKYDRKLCAQAIGLDVDELFEAEPQLLSAGNPVIFIPIKQAEAVDRAWLDAGGLARLKKQHDESALVLVFAPVSAGAYSRVFAPDHGVTEDPATGSATGPLARFMMDHGLVGDKDGTEFVSEQGVKMGRSSFLRVRIQGDNALNGIAVGGHVTPIIDATMKL